MTITSADIHVGSYASDTVDDKATIVKAPTKESLSSCLSSSNANGASLQSINIYLQSSEFLSHYDSFALASLVSSLGPNGTISVHVIISDGSTDNKMDWGVIMTSFVLAGASRLSSFHLSSCSFQRKIVLLCILIYSKKELWLEKKISPSQNMMN